MPLSMTPTRRAWTPRLMLRGANWEEQIWEGFVFFWATDEGFGACWPMGPPMVHAGLRGAGSSQASPLPPALPRCWAATEHPLGMEDTTGPSQYRLPHHTTDLSLELRPRWKPTGTPMESAQIAKANGGVEAAPGSPTPEDHFVPSSSHLRSLLRSRVGSRAYFFGRNPRREAPLTPPVTL